MAQQAKTPKGGRNLSTSDTRKAKYASYKGKHGGKQRNHSKSSKRSPLVRKTQWRVRVAEFAQEYKRVSNVLDNIRDGGYQGEPPELPTLGHHPQTLRMIGELRALGNYPIRVRESNRSVRAD